MSLLQIFMKELEQEAQITRKFLARVPDTRFEWQPHPKSMTLKRLVTHIADLPNWITMGLTTDELDFNSNNWQEPVLNSTAELMANFETSVQNANSSLQQALEQTLDEPWVLRQGEQVLLSCTKGEVVRMALSQLIHHRAQLGVDFRLLDIPVPASYGPSADEH